ncbi:helix-turn-helix domain-containing protein [Staphylococcus chromogenes]|uniref:helix-turn-helix domain-containing protein n=1 Tax=Staphylococcus chromogenes TaxID=46126 RepID=UPI000D1A80B1|nr:helix-turn-helix domain-containing protein [Staphylococcus chromogenes]PTG08627.1 transcriptional regulator [Staphylococcus chromogenes]PTG53526.1 transcriptional regulator [Staphylococcus chromogenes]RIM04494.1 helix-turn-helix domain-containing protein [Staphylococcus chromogenes]RIM21410.1 helix-turn-helix domain-containing protein [Staphylococcus chromogenes]
MKSKISARLKEAMKNKNLKQVDVVAKAKLLESEMGTKISKTDLSQYVNGKVTPGQNKLYVLAKILDVSEAWLLGYDVDDSRISDEKRSEINTLAAHLDGDYTEEELAKIREYAEMVRKSRDK